MADGFTHLSPREYNKLRGRGLKWVERFSATIAPLTLAEVLVPSSGEDAADGFVVLNGGVLAGCTPFQVRELLLDSGAMVEEKVVSISTDHGARLQPPPRTLYYGSTLPFIVVRRPLVTNASHVTKDDPEEQVTPPAASGRSPCGPLLSWATDIYGTRQQPRGSSSNYTVTLPPQAETDSLVKRLHLLPVPADRRFGKASSSLDDGARYLLLLQCRTELVLRAVGTQVQREVIGIEALLMNSSKASGTLVKAADAQQQELQSPRVLECYAIREIPGLFCVPDFLSQTEHDAALAEMNLHNGSIACEILARRRVAHVNRRFLYGVNTLGGEGVDVNPHPSFYGWMRDRLRNADNAVRIEAPYPITPDAELCDQLTVNYYQYEGEGSSACGIAAHVDAHSAFGDCIFIVSLGSHTVLEFEPFCQASAEATAGGIVYDEKAAPYGVYAAPRSLLLMTGECRYGWTHAIAERRTDSLCERLPTMPRRDRVSLTWRRGRDSPHCKATCPYSRLCDGE